MARRSAGRHARRIRRATPRRWLPFLALLAILVAAVAVERRDDDPTSAQARVPAPAALLPVAAEPDALSTAWYCSAGSATGSGTAELSVVLANAAPRGTTAAVTAYGSSGKRVHRRIDVPANGRTRVVAHDLLTDDWASLSVEVFGGRVAVEREVTGPQGVDASPCSSTASARWLVPSGSTAIGANEALFLFNPFPDDTSVDVTFATDDGPKSPRSLQGLLVAGHSLRVVPSSSLPARRGQIATKVTARTGRIVVDRLQVYDGKGDGVKGSGDDAVATPAPRGVAATAAIPAASARWLFPEGSNDDGTRSQVAIYNPSSRQARVELVLTYQDPGRNTPIDPIDIDVRPREQAIVDLTDTSGIETGVPYSIDVRSLDGVEVAAEQLRFGAAAPVPPPADGATEDDDAEVVPPGDPIVGFAVVPGSPVAATGWLLPSRGASAAEVASVVVANPGAATVTVRVDSVVGGRRQAVPGATVRIPGGDRRVLDLDDGPLNPALVITATGPVVVGHSGVVKAGLGVAQSLASPLPDTVTDLPPS